MSGMTPNNTQGSRSNSTSTGTNRSRNNNAAETNSFLAQLQARNNMMNELLQHRLQQSLPPGQAHNYPDLALLYRNGINQDASAVAAASAANNSAAAAAAAAASGSSIIQGHLNAMGNNNANQLANQLTHNMRRNSSLLFQDQQNPRRNSSLGLSGILGALSDDNFNHAGLPMLQAGNFNTLLGAGAGTNTPFERRTSLDILGDAAASVDLRDRIGKRRNSLDSASNTLDQSQNNLLNALNNVDSQILAAELDVARRIALQGNPELSSQRNNLEMALQQRRLNMEMEMAQRRNSLELAQRRNSLELAQRRNSADLVNNMQNAVAPNLSQSLALQEAQRRNSLELAQRRNSLELAQRRNSLELAQRRNSLELAQRRNSLELAQRRNSRDLLNNRPDPLRPNISQMLAEQLLNSDRRHTLSMGRNSSLQVGTNPIDPRHMESLFDEGSSLHRSRDIAGGMNQVDLQALMRRQSILQTLNAAQNLPPNQRLNQEQSNVHQPPLQNEIIDSEMFQQQISPFLNVVDSLQQKMEKSQESQKNIQIWDKQMGLKRSHSSTMTKTNRSRKQLRELFEAQKNLFEQRVGHNDNTRNRTQKKDSKDASKR